MKGNRQEDNEKDLFSFQMVYPVHHSGIRNKKWGLGRDCLAGMKPWVQSPSWPEPSVIVYTWNPSALGTEAGRLEAQNCPWLYIKANPRYTKPWIKNKQTNKQSNRCWRYGSVAKSAGFSSRGPSFSSQHSVGSLQTFMTSVPEDPTSSSGLCKHQTHINTCRQNTHIHKTKRKNILTFKCKKLPIQDWLPKKAQNPGDSM